MYYVLGMRYYVSYIIYYVLCIMYYILYIMYYVLYFLCRGMLPAKAEIKFLERVKWLDMYGVDLHPVRGQDNMEYLLGLTPTGIVLYKKKNKIGSFIW